MTHYLQRLKSERDPERRGPRRVSLSRSSLALNAAKLYQTRKKEYKVSARSHSSAVSQLQKHISSQYQGQSDTDLSSVGERQAELCGVCLQNERFTHVYASDLTRAYKTCEIIVRKNQKTTCSILKDIRLRERKFGVFEGKARCDFIAAAKKAKKKFCDFIPEGAENTSQVQGRAIAFFDDLCDEMKAISEKECIIDTPLSIKRRRINENMYSDDFPQPDNPGIDTASSLADCRECISDAANNKEVRFSRCESTSSSGCSSLSLTESTEQPSEQVTDQLLSDSDSREEFVPINSSTLSSVQDRELDVSAKVPRAASIYSCPNVSLSPLFGHRLPSMSSISSGRNSFDDGELSAPIIADVLLVSHGGLLKEFTSYFMQTLECKIPGGKRLSMQISPNTGISKFIVTLTDGGLPRVTCSLFHHKEHLNKANCDALEYGGEV